MESIQIFLKLDGLLEVELNVPAKAIQFILSLDKNSQKIDLLAMLYFDAAI